MSHRAISEKWRSTLSLSLDLSMCTPCFANRSSARAACSWLNPTRLLVFTKWSCMRLAQVVCKRSRSSIAIHLKWRFLRLGAENQSRTSSARCDSSPQPGMTPVCILITGSGSNRNQSQTRFWFLPTIVDQFQRQLLERTISAPVAFAISATNFPNSNVSSERIGMNRTPSMSKKMSGAPSRGCAS